MNASETVPILVIAGVSSGVGKTTVTLGLLEALRRRGLTVQAFKVGPRPLRTNAGCGGWHPARTDRPYGATNHGRLR